uniref:Uncharacterized protein n=1 Tax=Arundo donax TaxID=35708 RepID=A0A0A9F9N0_ARUDO
MLVMSSVGLSCSQSVRYTRSDLKYSGQTNPTQLRTWVIPFFRRMSRFLATASPPR